MTLAEKILMHSLIAPSRLVADTRGAFRQQSLAHLERRIADGAKVLTIDLGDTIEIDGSGLGMLVLLQKRAHEHGMTTRLLNLHESVRHRLSITKLDAIFDIA